MFLLLRLRHVRANLRARSRCRFCRSDEGRRSRDRRTQRFSLSTKKRRFCRLGRKRRLVRLFAWETLLPLIGPFPVTWHTRAMRALLIRFNSEFERQIHFGPLRATREVCPK